MTRSGLFDAPPATDSALDQSSLSGSYLITDMVSRLEPRSFRWIESSQAEQDFLGWSLEELQGRSFLEVVHPRDRLRALESLRQVLLVGECHGLIVRIGTAAGKSKVIEVNAGARYSADRQVKYIRCHLTDVSDKVRAERELRIRTRELTQVNDQLRQINRELEDLKNRYTDLYENAPAMYLSLDSQGRLIDCNQTVLTTLGRRREELIGQGFELFLAEEEVARCKTIFAGLMVTGAIETESRWVKSTGELIYVWISAKVVRGPRGDLDQTHCIAQDVTAKHRLEAELTEKNQSLARANAELSLKNRELDEFVYVVSHDLQEPLRTLTAFSDFLLEEQSAKLDAQGREYVGHLANAARRMRSMVHELLNLSRAGRVTEEFAPVDLGELAEVVKADLAELIRGRGARVDVNSRGEVLWGDRRRLQQLLANLISNGIKYNRSEVPHVEIDVDELVNDSTSECSWLTLCVRDNGIGIEPRHHQKIFKIFRRLHSQEEFEGNGVGLAICSKIVHAHGGQICLESTPGEGTAFYVSLPRAPAS